MSRLGPPSPADSQIFLDAHNRRRPAAAAGRVALRRPRPHSPRMDAATARPARAVPSLHDFPGRIEDRVRWGDVDGVGHANNVSFARYLEEGRLAMLRDLNEPGSSDPLFMLVHIDIDYLAQLRYPETVAVGTRIARIGRSSLHFEQAVFQEGRCAAVARAVVALADRASATSRPIPDALREELARRGMPGRPPA